MTDYIQSLHRTLGTPALIVPLIRRGLAGNNYRIIDLCSGAGGPMIDVVQTLRSQSEYSALSLVLTDLFPHVQVAELIELSRNEWQQYETRPIDAANVPSELVGLRTMICSLHHMRPDIAKSILHDASAKKQPFLAFEISDNSPPLWLWWTAIPIGFVLSLVMTLRVRPLSFRHIFFTYCVPVIPFFLAWDGAVSNARTYTKADLQELLVQFESVDYEWEIDTVKPPSLPMPMLYILGLPKSS